MKVRVDNSRIKFWDRVLLRLFVFPKDGLRVMFAIKCKSWCVNIIFEMVSSRRDIHIKKTGVLPIGTKILFCGRGLTFFSPPRGTNSCVTHHLCHIFSAQFPKGTVKSPAVDLLRLNTF